MSDSKLDVDALDRKIIAYLQDDGRTPFTTIAKDLDIAEATVRKRVARLIEEGILEIVGIVDPRKAGKNTGAIVGLRTEGNSIEKIAEALEKLPEVVYFGICAGTYDVIIEVAVESNEALYNFLTHKLRDIPGITGSDTSLLMKVYKQRHSWKLESAR